MTNPFIAAMQAAFMAAAEPAQSEPVRGFCACGVDLGHPDGDKHVVTFLLTEDEFRALAAGKEEAVAEANKLIAQMDAERAPEPEGLTYGQALDLVIHQGLTLQRPGGAKIYPQKYGDLVFAGGHISNQDLRAADWRVVEEKVEPAPADLSFVQAVEQAVSDSKKIARRTWRKGIFAHFCGQWGELRLDFSGFAPGEPLKPTISDIRANDWYVVTE